MEGTPQLDPSSERQSAKKRRVWILLLSVFLIAPLATLIYYAHQQSVIEWLALPPEPQSGSLVPIRLNLPDVITFPARRMLSYYGFIFTVPWNEMPTVATSSDGLTTQLRFSGGQFIDVFAQSFLPHVAGDLLAASQSDNGTISAIQDVYGTSTLGSNVETMSLILNSSPDTMSGATSTKARLAEKMLLDLKGEVVRLLVDNPSAIYYILTPRIRAFEFAGYERDQKRQDHKLAAIAHILFFDTHDVAHDIVVGNSDQSEINFILASLSVS